MKNSLRIFIIGIGIFCGGRAMAASQAEQIVDLSKRVDALEKQEQEQGLNSAETRDGVKPFLNHPISFGGFFESALTGLTGPDTDRQLSANSHIIGINLSSELSSNIRFVSQFITGLSFQLENPHNDPRQTKSQRIFGAPSFGALVAQAYAEYEISDALRIRTGLGYVPYGFAMQQREPVLFLRRGGPQMSSATSLNSVGIANPLWMGLDVLGSFETNKSDSQFGYEVYTHSPFVDAKTLGFGTRLWHRPSNAFQYGYSMQNGAQGGKHYFSHGLDAHWKGQRYGVTAEVARNTTTNGDEIATSYYAEPSISFSDDEYVLFAVGDYLDNEGQSSLLGATVTPDPYKKWVYGIGFNWLPSPFVRYRAVALVNDYVGSTAVIAGQNRDYYSIDLSVGVAF